MIKKESSDKNFIRKKAETRTAVLLAVVGAAFLCLLTFAELVALNLETERGKPVSAGAVLMDDTEEPAGMPDTENTKEPAGMSDTENTKESAGMPDTENTKEPAGMPDTEDTERSAASEEIQEPVTAIPAVDAEFPYYIKVNREQNCVTIYQMDENGEYTIPYKAMVCSTGLHDATPLGTYDISDKYRWRALSGGVYGQYATRICGEILFHSVPYYTKSGDNLCTDEYNELGQQASMGCVRLTVQDAKWIAENCPSGTMVEIYDDDDPGPLGKPEAVRIDSDNPNKNWDPTDPDEENPWQDWSQDR